MSGRTRPELLQKVALEMAADPAMRYALRAAPKQTLRTLKRLTKAEIVELNTCCVADAVEKHMRGSRYRNRPLASTNIPRTPTKGGGTNQEGSIGGPIEGDPAPQGAGSPAVLLSLANRLDIYVTASGGLVWRATSFDGGNSWAQPWIQLSGDDVQNGTLSSIFGPKAAGSGDGRVTYLVGRSSNASDQGFYVTSSENYHVDWGVGWTFANCALQPPGAAGCNPVILSSGDGWSQIGDGTGAFLSGPAVATSGNGQIVYVVGLGLTSTMYWATSMNAGVRWGGWAPIPGGSAFLSGPAIATNGDGLVIYVVGQRSDKKMYYTRSSNGGGFWAPWRAIGSGTFPRGSVPSVATSADGETVYVVAQGLNYEMYYAQSIDSGDHWPISWGPIGSGSFPLGASPSATTSWDASTLHVFAQGNDGNVWRATGSKSGGGVNWNVAWIIAG